jgi:hypothetical protein
MESGTEARSKNTFEHVSVNAIDKVAQLARLICPDVIRVRVEDLLQQRSALEILAGEVCGFCFMLRRPKSR